MTEQEARLKWCPMTRYRPEGPISNLPTGEGKCIASDCMAWLTESYELQPDKSQILHGYCGLAGKP